jgi:hypothetical protein
MYIRSEFKKKVDSFDFAFDCTLDELGYAYSRLSFFQFIAFVFFLLKDNRFDLKSMDKLRELKSENRVLSIKLARKEKRKKRNKAKRKKTHLNVVEQKVVSLSSNLKSLSNVDPKASRKVAKNLNRLLQKKANYLKKKKNSPSYKKRQALRAEKFLFLSPFVNKGYKFLIDFFGFHVVSVDSRGFFKTIFQYTEDDYVRLLPCKSLVLDNIMFNNIKGVHLFWEKMLLKKKNKEKNDVNIDLNDNSR